MSDSRRVLKQHCEAVSVTELLQYYSRCYNRNNVPRLELWRQQQTFNLLPVKLSSYCRLPFCHHPEPGVTVTNRPETTVTVLLLGLLRWVC